MSDKYMSLGEMKRRNTKTAVIVRKTGKAIKKGYSKTKEYAGKGYEKAKIGIKKADEFNKKHKPAEKLAKAHKKFGDFWFGKPGQKKKRKGLF